MGILSKILRLGALFLLLLATIPAGVAVSIMVDGSQTFQTIDGFGANIHYDAWTNDELKPVLDAMIDQGGFTQFRVIFDNTDWETANDNADPSVMNWDYYNALYATPRFQRLWGLMAYLNQKGITNGLMLNFQGPGPAWFGQPLNSGLEGEWAEMIASLLIYARNTQHLQFTLVSPDNEPNSATQGVEVNNANQYVTMLHKLAGLLDTNGVGDIRFVGPDLANGTTAFMPQMTNDPVVMAKVAHFGMHSYSAGGVDSAGVYDYLNNAGYGDRGFWMTEFNVWCPSCESGGGNANDWTYNRGTAEYLLAHLLNGASAGIVWEGYDAFEATRGPGWSYWGLFGVDDINAAPKTYTARKDFYTLSQIANYVRPGARQLAVGGLGGQLALVAFYNPSTAQFSIVGANTNTLFPRTLNCTLSSLPAFSTMDLYYTTSALNGFHGATVPVVNGSFSLNVPPDCIFAITGFAVPPPAPNLQAQLDTNGLTLSWPAAVTNFTLEATANQPSAGWSVVTNPPLSTNGQFQVLMSPAANQQFFRLRWP